MYTKKQKYMRLLAQHSVSQKSGENIKYSLFSGQWYRVRADNTLLLVDQRQGEKLSGEQGRKNLGHFQNLYNFH